MTLYKCVNVHFDEREIYIPPQIESITKEYDTHSSCNDYWQWLKDWYIHRPLQVQGPCDNNTDGWTKESLIGKNESQILSLTSFIWYCPQFLVLTEYIMVTNATSGLSVQASKFPSAIKHTGADIIVTHKAHKKTTTISAGYIFITWVCKKLQRIQF